MYRYTEVYGGPAPRIFSAATLSSSSLETSRAKAPRSAATTRLASSTGISTTSNAEGGSQRGEGGAAADHDFHDLARLVASKGISHGLEVWCLPAADAGNDVIAPQARPLSRTARTHSHQAYSAG